MYQHIYIYIYMYIYRCWERGVHKYIYQYIYIYIYINIYVCMYVCICRCWVGGQRRMCSTSSTLVTRRSSPAGPTVSFSLSPCLRVSSCE